MKQKLLTAAEMAERLNIPVDTLNNMRRRAPEFPYYKTGYSGYRYVEQDVLEWLKTWNGFRPYKQKTILSKKEKAIEY